MDAEKTIAEIELLEQLFALPDPRKLGTRELASLNRLHDERCAANPWFKLWQRYGI
ncbi:MAG TPA: hypothetical protein VMU28_13235 [Terriglobales bacterium]|nr:hypothetical protein [Terriglobales bacterium]